jgi:hypothetical protein
MIILAFAALAISASQLSEAAVSEIKALECRHNLGFPAGVHPSLYEWRHSAVPPAAEVA